MSASIIIRPKKQILGEVGSKADRWVGNKLNCIKCGTAMRGAGSATYRNGTSIPQVEDRLELRRNDHPRVKYS